MIRLFKHYIPHAVVMLVIVELLLLIAAGEAAWHLRTRQIAIASGPIADRLLGLVSFAVIVESALIAVGGYTPESLRSLKFAASRLVVAIGFGVVGVSLLNFLVAGDVFWRSILLYALALAFLFLLASRAVLGPLLGTSRFQRRVLVLGGGARAQRLHQLASREGSSFTVIAFVTMGTAPSTVAGAIPRSSIQDLGQFVEAQRVGEVVLAVEERRNALPLKDLLRIKTRGIPVQDFSSFIERETGRVDLDSINPSWLIFSDGFSAGRAVSSFAKRLIDLVASLLILVLAWPLLLLFALLVKLESAGPAFYTQIRVGHYGQHFVLYKLRSMRSDAEGDGARWADLDDPRVTRIGRFIRIVRIDELPQAWNVLKGDMSFVGPRPERPQFVADLERQLPYYEERHMVKPGITGWAQINYPYAASIEDARNKLEYDLYYAKNYSPFLDALILLQTLRVILWPQGAR